MLKTEMLSRAFNARARLQIGAGRYTISVLPKRGEVV
jgi:hypothetical protein